MSPRKRQISATQHRLVDASIGHDGRLQHGSALVMTLITLTFGLAFASVLLYSSSQSQLEAHGKLNRLQADYAAESVTVEVVEKLVAGEVDDWDHATSPNWSEGPFTSAGFDAEGLVAHLTDGSNVLPGLFPVTATSQIEGGGQKQLRIVYRWEGAPDNPFAMAAFGSDDVEIAGSSVYSYDSRTGATFDNMAHVGSDSLNKHGIHIYGTAIVRGDAVVNPQAADPDFIVKLDPSQALTGVARRAAAPFQLPTVTPPPGLTAQPSFSLSSGLQTLPGGDYWYSSVSLSGTAALRFSGFARLFLSGPLNVSDAASLGPTSHEPTKLQIYGTPQCTTIAISPNLPSSSELLSAYGSLRAGVYAPQAAITIGNGARAFGSLVGKTLSAGSCQIWRDVALTYVPSPFTSGRVFRRVSWETH